MRRILPLSLMAGAVTLAIIIGQRMSTDAMAVMIGVVFGVAASIPTSLLIALAARGSRRDDPPYRRNDYQPSPPAPQIYVVAPGQVAGGMPGASQQALPQPPSHYYIAEPNRRYKIVGESEYWLDEPDTTRWE